MLFSPWFIFALLTFFCWGVSDFLPKIATNNINPKSAYFYESIGRFIVGLFVLSLFLKFQPGVNFPGVLASFISGLLGGLGMLFFFLAASRGKISQVVLFTALYPMFTTLLAIVILNEDVSLRQGAGIILAFGALYLLK